jgi:starvation-inducible DNA-binding protein
MRSNRNDSHNLKPHVITQPNIGLDKDIRQSVVELLNIILADEVLLATKTRNAYWNAGGAGFHELHTRYATQYHLLNNISNEIAERTRILGGFAIGSLVEFLKHTRLEEQPGDIPDILHLLADHEASIRFLRDDARKCTEEYEDEGTFELLVTTMRLHEKMAWMLRSIFETE